MSVTTVLVFACAVSIAMASPGPAVATLLARVIGRRTSGVLGFCAGLILGDVIWFTAAMFGLAALMEAAQPLFAALKYIGAAYLIWLAWNLWTAPATPPNGEATVAPPRAWSGLAGGLALALGNPKTMVFYLALAPMLVDPTRLAIGDFLVLVSIMVVLYTSILSAYVTLAMRARQVLHSPRAIRFANRTAGTMMAGAAVAVATR
jgi:threonine/homoserine/homoserine lactone efflux protein